MRGSPFGKWIIGHRYQAQLWIPGLVSLVFIVLYFFGNLYLQSMVAPGIYEPPLLSGMKLGLTDVLKAYLLLWILILVLRTLIVTPDTEVRFICVFIGIGIIGTALAWADDNALANRLWSGVMETDGSGGVIANFLSGGWFTIEFVVITALTLLFFVVIPLLYGGSRNPVTAIIAPSRWMLATVALMYLFFRMASALQAQGWGAVKGVEGALGSNTSLFLVIMFQYMVLLYMAELNYHSAVRKEAPDQTWRLRH